MIEDLEHLTSADLAPEMRQFTKSENRLREAADAAVRLCCRYLNSGVPLIAILREWSPQTPNSGRHAVVVCGYSRLRDEASIELIVNDDKRGPYLTVSDILSERDGVTAVTRKWETLLAPVPEKLSMTGAVAERVGLTYLIAAVRRASAVTPTVKYVLDLLAAGNLDVRTYFSRPNNFKERIRKRCADPVVIREYNLARMPHFVWIVEAIDRNAHNHEVELGLSYTQNRCVLGEIILDATSDYPNLGVVATRLPGLISVWEGPKGELGKEYACGTDLIVSGR
jgi:hypothetical protein